MAARKRRAKSSDGAHDTEPTECVVDLTNVHDEDERALLLTLKARIDAHLRGETQMVSMAEADRQVRKALSDARALRRARTNETG